MSAKHSRVIGTTEEAVARAEDALKRTLPPSFREWILTNNGLGISGITIFPIKDERDPRKTWESIDHRFRGAWAAWLRNFEGENKDFSHLIPFAEYGTGDFYCFDYLQPGSSGEVEVVRWSHETGETEFRASSFNEFVALAAAGAYKYD